MVKLVDSCPNEDHVQSHLKLPSRGVSNIKCIFSMSTIMDRIVCFGTSYWKCVNAISEICTMWLVVEFMQWISSTLTLQCFCDAWPVRRRTYSYLPSHKASPHVGWYQIILLGDRGTCVLTTCPGLHSTVGRLGFELEMGIEPHTPTRTLFLG